MTEASTHVLFCNCTYGKVIPPEAKRQVLEALCRSGAPFEAVADLCEMAARKDPALARLAAKQSVKIAACFPRAIRSLFRAAGAPLSDDGVEIVNMRAACVDASAGQLIAGGADGAPSTCSCACSMPTADDVQIRVRAVQQAVEVEHPGHRKPWFPVIDTDRCTNCLQCLSFCLFDVYGLDEDGRVQVKHPDHCKTDCPACSRVCPSVAIMFPKYEGAPINGAEVSADDPEQETVKVDVSSLLGGDASASLRARGKAAKTRFSVTRNDDAALAERRRCLAEVREELGIPTEVLNALSATGGMADGVERAKQEAARRQKQARGGEPDQSPPSEEDWGI